MDVKKESFLKLTVRFALVFLVLISIVKVFLSIFNTGSFDGMIEANFGSENFVKFLTTNLIFSLFYGLFMAGYYKFIKK